MEIQAVVFDFDGLLMDTESCLLASWQHEWRQHDLELDVESFWADHGGDVTQDQQTGSPRRWARRMTST